MDTAIRIETREVYGRTLAYPANDQAKALAKLVRAKSLSRANLQDAIEMGFTVILVSHGVDLRTIDNPADYIN